MDVLPLAAIAEAINIPAGELDKFRKEGDVDVTPEVFQKKVTDYIKTHVTGSVERTKTGSWQEGFDAAKRKTLTDKEREIQSKYPGLEGKTLDELIESAYKHGGNTDFTKDPAVQGEFSKREARIKALELELAAEKQERVKTISTMKLESTIPTILKDKFTIPGEAKTAQKRMNILMGEILQGGKVEIKEVNGVLVPWNTESNKQVQNGQYIDLSLDEYVLGLAADIYEPFTGSQHKAPGNNEDQTKGGPKDVPTELAAINTFDQVYAYRNSINPNDKGAKDKLKALNDYVEKRQKSANPLK